MDLLAAAQRMAENVVPGFDDDAVPAKEVRRWQKLFNYSKEEAESQIRAWRQNLDRSHISYTVWKEIRSQWESLGYSKEAYEYSIYIAGSQSFCHVEHDPSRQSPGTSSSRTSWLVRLEGTILDLPLIQSILSLPRPPSAVKGFSEDAEAMFCEIDGASRFAIEQHFTRHGSSFDPTFISISKAAKDLSSTSIYPTLGKDATLPQHRLNTLNTSTAHAKSPSPLQNTSPVCYFIYGTLAEPECLARVLELPVEEVAPKLVAASVSGGAMEMWGQYNAMVDSSASDTVRGKAFRVETEEQEDSLRLYETKAYEVVRCSIRMEGGECMAGLTFRFVQSP